MKKILTLSIFVKYNRKSINLTQLELAEKAGVSLRLIKEIEHGKATVRVDKVNQVLKIFNHKMAPVEDNVGDDI